MFTFHSGETDDILILCAFITMFAIGTSLSSRSSWPEGAQTGRRIPKSSNRLLKGTHERKRFRSVPDAVQLPFSSSEQTP